jgi:hypothetical protein
MKPNFSSPSFTVALSILFVVVCASTFYEPPARAAAPVVGLWRFNEGNGTNIADSSGFGNNGTLQGDGGNLPTWAAGQTGFGSALRFTNDALSHTYVSIPGSDSLKIGQTASDAWTITAWAYEDSGGTSNFVASYGRIVVLDDGQAFQWESGATGDGQMYSWSRPPNTAWEIGWGTASPVTPLLDQWVHWAIVYDGTNLTIYRNGNQGAQGGIASNAVTAALGFVGYRGSVEIGSEFGQPADRNWNGLLDDVAIFAGALSEAEIRTVMTGDFSAHQGGPAHIITQPQGHLVPPGSDVTFSVVAQGLAPLSYQWYFNTNNALAHQTNSTLVLTNVQPSQAGTYSVTVTNSLAVDRSQPAILIVNTNKALLVGLWRFNEGTGTNVMDSSGYGNNGTLTGDGGNIPVWTTGQAGFGGALRFTNDAVNHTFVTIPGSSSLMIGQTATNPWSLTAWAYEDSGGSGTFVATYGRVFVIDGGDAFQFESGAMGDGEIYTWSRPPNTAWEIGWGTASPVTPLLDQWVHWAIVYDGTNLTIYRNGNQGAQGGTASNPVTAPLGYSTYTGAIQIGSEAGQPANRNWNGMLDDVAVFNTALSQAEVNTVMAGNFSSFIAQPSVSINGVQGNVVLSWSAALPGFQLQSSPSLATPQWTDVTTSRVQQGTVFTVTVPIGATPQFFRLIIR